MPFHNRQKELRGLAKAHGGESSLLVLYGRRRVGKTELLRHFYAGRPHVFYMADQTSSALHVQDLCKRLGDHWGDRYLSGRPVMSWTEFFTYLAEKGQPLDLVLDEFPYLCDAEPALPSILQRFWDESGSRSGVHLTLCGSSVSFMESQVLSERSPLFGRRTAQMLLKPLNFWEAADFLKGYSPTQRVEAYGCLGGMPAYLTRIDPQLSLAENLLAQALDPVAYLHDEPRLLLRQEVREPRVYLTVLRALAAGRTRLNEIAQECQLATTAAARYLELLGDLQVVERTVPVTENPANSRKGLYRIIDPYMRFWFRFIQPNLSELEIDRADEVMRHEILPHLPHFLVSSFEQICRAWLRINPNALPFRPKTIGAWWDRGHEVDIVAYDRENVFFGECKWSDNPLTPAAHQQLLRNSGAVPGFDRHTKHYGLFSKSGFVERVPGCLYFGLEDLARCS